jgi:hypothetical protein
MDAAAELEGAMPVLAKEESGIRGRELARVERSCGGLELCYLPRLST